MKKVYLAGPITGQDIDTEWRFMARRFLSISGIEVLDPLRNTDAENIVAGGLALKDGSEIDVAQDMVDVKECDYVLAHFPYSPKRQATGTLMELGAAHAYEKHIVLSIAPGGPECIRQHPFAKQFCNYITTDVVKAIEWIIGHCMEA